MESRQYHVRLWVAAVVVALGSCSASAWQLSASWDYHLHATRELVMSLANATAQRIAVTLHGMDVLLQDVTEKISSPHSVSLMQIEAFRGKLGAYPELEALGIIDAKGQLLRAIHTAAHFPALPIDVSDRQNFSYQRQHARENLLHINPPVLDRLTGKQVLLLSRPLVDGNGDFGGMVSMAVLPRFIDRALAAAVSKDDAAGAVFSTDGIVYSRYPVISDLAGKSIVDTQFFHTFSSIGWEGTYDRTISFADGHERIVGFRRVPNFPLMVAVGVGRQQVEAEWWREVAIHSAIQMTFISGLMVLAWNLSRSEQRRQAMAAQMLDRERQHIGTLEQAVRDRTQELNASLDALRDNEERFRRLLETSPVALVLTNLSDGRVKYINWAGLDLFGVSLEEAINRSAADYWIDPSQRNAIIATISNMGSVRDQEVQLRRYNNEVFTALISATLFTFMGEQMSLIAVQDISSRKKLETELARSNTDLEQFSYAVSHDLQEPLRMVSSYMTLLKRRYQGKLDQEADDFIGYAVDGALRMNRMITDLLEYSRVNRQGSQFTTVSLDQSLQEALANLSKVIEETHATITAPALPSVQGDGSQLMRLLQNVIGNAIKYHHPDRAPDIAISVQPHQGQWQIGIRDNGIGIDPSQINRLFQVFQRLHPKGQYEGTGIGLAVCRRIVERHGGQIWVESAGDGQGSTFYITLPMQRADDCLPG